MKKPLLFFITAAILVSCEKKENQVPDLTGTEDKSYIINGISNKTIDRLGGITTSLELVYQEGEQENIELSATDLPEGVEVAFEPSSGIPGFNSTMRISSSLTKAGVHPIKIHGVSTSGKIKTYTFDITVKDNFHCDSLLIENIGVFYTRQEPSTDTVYSQTFLRPYFYSNAFPVYYLTNVYLETVNGRFVTTGNSGSPSPNSNNVRFLFNCADHSIEIEETEVRIYNYDKNRLETYKLSGAGIIDFKKKTVVINYQVHTPLNAIWNYRMLTNLRLNQF